MPPRLLARSPFDAPHKMQALLLLPGTLLAKAKRLGPPSTRTAHEVQSAAIIELLLHIPMRSEPRRQAQKC